MRKIRLFIGVLVISSLGLGGCLSQTSQSPEAVPSEPAAENISVADADSKAQAAVDYLQEQVPEISNYASLINQYNQENATDNKLVIYVNGVPEPTSSDIYRNNYFNIYVGEDLGTHTSRFATFLVRQDLQEILVDDVLTGQYITLAEWRQQQ